MRDQIFMQHTGLVMLRQRWLLCGRKMLTSAKIWLREEEERNWEEIGKKCTPKKQKEGQYDGFSQLIRRGSNIASA